MGSFTSQDSYRGEYNNPLTQNLYTYCAGDPVDRVDPTGHSWLDKWYKKLTKSSKKRETSNVNKSKSKKSVKKQSKPAKKNGKKILSKRIRGTKQQEIFIYNAYYASGSRLKTGKKASLNQMRKGMRKKPNAIEEIIYTLPIDVTLTVATGGSYAAGGAVHKGAKAAKVVKAGSKAKRGTKATTEFDQWLNAGPAENRVYFGYIDDVPEYTGITKQTLAQRNAGHRNSKRYKREFQNLRPPHKKLDGGLTRNQARAIEQYYIDMPGGPNNLNRINSIAHDSIYYKPEDWAKNYLKGIGLIK